MEEGLLFKAKDQEEEGGKKSLTWDAFVEEAKKVGYIAGPMVAANLSLQLISVISLMMVGHLGEIVLAGTAMATSLCAVTGSSLLVGMASGLETLCGQAYGAQQYHKLGVHAYSAMISLILVCIPISFVWISMEKILIFIGQDPVISREAGRYATCMIPALFSWAIFQPLMKYLQTQSLIVPMLLSSTTTLCLHIPLCWVFVFYLGFGNIGAAFASCISYWLNVVFLGLYVKYSPSCKSTRVSLSKEAFQGIGEFLSLAVPSAVMVCLQWWSFEIMILLSGLLPNPQLETSVLSICLTSISLLYMIPSGIAAAVSTRVSNELGAGRPQAAQLAVFTTMIIAGTEIAIVSSTLFVCRYIVGYAYSNAEEVVDYVTTMVPLICLSTILDGLQGVLSGIARGSGWQHIGAYVNLGSLYIGGIPVSLLLGFFLNWRGRGLWLGIMSGAAIQTIILCIITIQTNWEKQVSIRYYCYSSFCRLGDMEECLLFKAKDQEEEGGKKSLTWDAFVEEAKKVGYIAGPMVAVTLSFQLISVISLMMVGHLGEVALSSTAMATSLCAVTGPSLLVGMASGLETLCGQAYGAQQYQKLGVYTYSAMISLTLVCIPISFVWISMENILTFTGQDPVISHEAGRYAICFIPALFGRAILHPLIKYLQTQSLIVPMLLSSMTTLCLHIPLCWVFVFHLGFGNIGAAFACSISYWLNVLILGLYVKYSPSCKSTRVPLSKEAFQGIGEFLSLAVPSAVMVCLQWWSFEIMIFTRVSNELGAGRPQAARLAVFTVMIIEGTEIVVVSSTLFVCRHIVGYAYSNAKEVVDYVTAMVPLICLSTILDGLQGVISGIARGSGWQRIGAYVNLGSLYIGGIPVSLLLGFFLNWRGRGLWLGIMSGAAIQTVILCVITIQTNWQKQAEIARKRIFQ
ncbi:hypothetical protein MKX03_010504 [Papaver bracteatum]|nr:hypothetical protein MKX03_010504 [Papaver bracteatum]